MSERVVLYVEDEPADATLAREAAAQVDPAVRIEVVENAVQAFEFLDRRGRFATAPVPDAVVIDLNLPIIGGHKVLSVVRAHERWRNLPVYVFTSSPDPNDRAIARALGATVAQKPKTWPEYVRLVETLFGCLGQPARAG